MHKFPTVLKTVTIFGYKIMKMTRKRHKYFNLLNVLRMPSHPDYFFKVKAKRIFEDTITDTHGHTLNSGEKCFPGKNLQNL